MPGESYTLEVSSPGIDRKLSKPRDFERVVGQKIRLAVRDPIEGQTHFEGKLARLTAGCFKWKRGRPFGACSVRSGAKGEAEVRVVSRRLSAQPKIESSLLEVFHVASIYQSIEMLSKEKGIDPQIVLDAVKDAMLAAARKHFRSKEDLIADLDESTGNIQIYSVKQVVEAVEDPAKQITLSAAKRIRERARSARKSGCRSQPMSWGASPPKPRSR